MNHSVPVRQDARPKKLVRRTVWYTQKAETYRGGQYTVESAPYQIQESILVLQTVKEPTVKPIVLKEKILLD